MVGRSSKEALMRHGLITAILAVGLALSAGCGKDKSATKSEKKPLPEDPCERLAACSIDKSCGGSLLGEEVHKKCGEKDTCEAVTQCVADDLTAAMAKAGNTAELTPSLRVCGHVFNFRGGLPKASGLKAGCKPAFARMEQWAQTGKDDTAKMMACMPLRIAAGMGDDFAERYAKACPGDPPL